MTALGDPAWLTSSATRAVIAALEAKGGVSCARFVGGCVRNALIGRPVDDIDVATTLKPEDTQTAIVAAGLKAVPTGIAHGTVTAVSEKRPYEITTLRRDVTTDGRNATVAFTDDWAEDAGRRDFRLNALYADADGQVFDPTGEGVADALAGRIVFVGDPKTRIREDYLRILRFFRFFAWYGRGELDAAGLKACKILRTGMVRLSAERVSKELMKLLAAPDPVPAMRAMAETGVLEQVLPEAKLTRTFETLCGLADDPEQRLMGLVAAQVGVAETLAQRLRLPNSTRDRLVAAARTLPAVHLDMDEAAARAAIYRHGGRAVGDAVLRRLAASPDQAEAARRLWGQAYGWTPPKMPVTGKDAVQAGLEAGPLVGKAIKLFEDGWVADDFPISGHEDRLAAAVTAVRG